MKRKELQPGERFYYLYGGCRGHFSYTVVSEEHDKGPGFLRMVPSRPDQEVERTVP